MSEIVINVTTSFPELLCAQLDAPNKKKAQEIMTQPGFTLLSQHRQMTTGDVVDSELLLKELLENTTDPAGVRRVLDYWKTRIPELEDAATEVVNYLPQNTLPSASLHFVTGYDIGVATPRGAAINIGHQHFLSDPEEILYYAIHELHHVGFFKHQAFPGLSGLNRPQKLCEVVRYFTQMEGMAVYAAYEMRKDSGRLTTDADYQVFVDSEVARRVGERYREVLSWIPEDGEVESDLIVKVLTTMSSDERLWYRFGALIAWEIDLSLGRGVLVDSIVNPSLFVIPPL
ncbi:hypothetical protein K8R78_00200 [bacterium]|nr:hypothetical protein [bacterium]